jgi:hypothetical protein
MQRVVLTVIIILFIAPSVYAQEHTASLSDVRKAYEEFDYDRVISISERLIASPDTFSASSRIMLLTLNGVAHFIKGDEIPARKSFFEVLKIDSTFTLDSVSYSPKIVEFFNQARKGIPQPTELQRVLNEQKTINDHTPLNPQHVASHSFSNILARSMLLPGWGHLTVESSPKGWFLTAAAAITVASSIYYVVKTNNRESEYLNETDRQNIAKKYEDYNSAYKTRNIFLGAYAVIWTVAQVDLLFISHDELSGTLSVTYQNTLPADLSPYPSFSVTLNF